MCDIWDKLFPPKLYGAYSVEAARRCGTHIYLRPDGTEVEITFVSLINHNSTYLWEDVVWVGEIVKFVRPGRPAQVLHYLFEKKCKNL
jgi:hypothetical protein